MAISTSVKCAKDSYKARLCANKSSIRLQSSD